MVLKYAPTPVSSPDFDERWTMCYRKLHFYTEAEARRFGKKRPKSDRKTLYLYACPVHQPQHWHLTHRASFAGQPNASVKR